MDERSERTELEILRPGGGPRTLRIVLLLLCTRPVDLADVGGRVARLRLLVVAALVEDLRQVGSVDLPELLEVIESSAEVPVFTCGSPKKMKLNTNIKNIDVRFSENTQSLLWIST